MDLKQLKYYKEKNGYTDEILSVLSGVELETIQKIFTGDLQAASVKELLAIEEILQPEEKPKSPMCIKESAVQYDFRKDCYTLEDYYALPDDLRVELIDGRFFVMDAPTTLHQSAVLELGYQIKDFIKRKKGKCTVFVSPVDVQLDCDNKTMLQPDVLIVCDSDKIIRRCIMGAPDFIVEILSPSTKVKDALLKRRKYQEAGVREYWLVDTEKQCVTTYFFEEGDIPMIHGFETPIPIRIYGGELKINFMEIAGL